MIAVAAAAAALFVVYWTAVPARARRAVFAVAAITVLAAFFPVAVAVVAALALASRAVGGRGASGARTGAAVALCVGALALAKYGDARVRVVGLSYAVFRLVHVLVDARQGGTVPSPARLLEYVLFAPAFVSGPIERLPGFLATAPPARLSLDDAFWGVRRLLFGLAKKLYVSEPLRRFAEGSFRAPDTLTAGLAWEALFAYALFVYLDFSSYCDLALGVARLFGFPLPENFRWPYLARDIADFWRRWHITLSTWLRDYLYVPVSARLAHVGALRRRPVAIGVAATLVTMLACGLWHGEGASFALWGLGHGLLLAAQLVYRQRVLGALPAARRRALSASRSYAVACWAATVVAVSLLWVLFRFPPAGAVRFYGRLLGV